MTVDAAVLLVLQSVMKQILSFDCTRETHPKLDALCLLVQWLQLRRLCWQEEAATAAPASVQSAQQCRSRIRSLSLFASSLDPLSVYHCSQTIGYRLPAASSGEHRVSAHCCCPCARLSLSLSLTQDSLDHLFKRSKEISVWISYDFMTARE